jgi:membrane-bound ClpP family serine protease
MNTLLWVAVLLLLGLGVMVLEVFVPSGGILGLVSILALVAGIATAFLSLGALAGLIAIAIVLVAVPAVLGLALRWFPETPLGRRVMPPPPDAADLVPAADRRRRARDLVGRAGRVVDQLVPWGRVEIDGVAIDAVSEGGAIDAGTAVEVVAAQGTAVVVRAAAATLPARPAPAGVPADLPADLPAGPVAGGPPEESAGAEKADAAGPSALSRALEDFEFDRLDAPDA